MSRSVGKPDGHDVLGLIVVALVILALLVVRYWRVMPWHR